MEYSTLLHIGRESAQNFPYVQIGQQCDDRPGTGTLRQMTMISGSPRFPPDLQRIKSSSVDSFQYEKSPV